MIYLSLCIRNAKESAKGNVRAQVLDLSTIRFNNWEVCLTTGLRTAFFFLLLKLVINVLFNQKVFYFILHCVYILAVVCKISVKNKICCLTETVLHGFVGCLSFGVPKLTSQ